MLTYREACKRQHLIFGQFLNALCEDVKADGIVVYRKHLMAYLGTKVIRATRREWIEEDLSGIFPYFHCYESRQRFNIDLFSTELRASSRMDAMTFSKKDFRAFLPGSMYSERIKPISPALLQQLSPVDIEKINLENPAHLTQSADPVPRIGQLHGTPARESEIVSFMSLRTAGIRQPSSLGFSLKIAFPQDSEKARNAVAVATA